MDYFKNCFGIIAMHEADPEEIILSFEPYQGKYIKSYPLHESQKILIDNETELRVSLYLYETYDLIMDLLSFGSTMKVIKPKSLVEAISGIVETMNLIVFKVKPIAMTTFSRNKLTTKRWH